MTTSQEQIVGSLSVIGGNEVKVEVVELENGQRGILLTITSEGGSEVELLLDPEDAQPIGLDLMVFARDVAEFNRGGLA